jgi:hypothetical protein
MRFGDDWPGVFFRGDDALRLAAALEAMLDGEVDELTLTVVRDFCTDLLSCRMTLGEPEGIQRAFIEVPDESD